MENWFLYVIRCNDNSLYTGITTDVKRRMQEHLCDGRKGSKYLRGKGPLTLVMKRKIGDKSLAAKVEAKVKKMPKAKKELLLTGKITMKEIITRCHPPA